MFFFLPVFRFLLETGSLTLFVGGGRMYVSGASDVRLLGALSLACLRRGVSCRARRGRLRVPAAGRSFRCSASGVFGVDGLDLAVLRDERGILVLTVHPDSRVSELPSSGLPSVI